MPDLSSDPTKVYNLRLYKAVLFLKVMQDHYEKAWMSPLRYENTMDDGMFIAGITLPSGNIGILLPTTFWDLAVQTKAKRLPKAPKLEAQSDAETIKRLLQWVSYAHKAGAVGITTFNDFMASMSKARENDLNKMKEAHK